jgi:hypothetical protein
VSEFDTRFAQPQLHPLGSALTGSLVAAVPGRVAAASSPWSFTPAESRADRHHLTSMAKRQTHP